MSYRLGVDVGGTFTDLLLIDEATGTTHRAKTPSTPSDQSLGVIDGVGKVCATAGIVPAQITHFLHGTTVATNAVLEATGARIGLVTTQGFRQVLQIARSYVPGGLAGWITWPKPQPLAALEDTVEAIERVDTYGTVLTPLDEDDLRAKLRRLRAQGIEVLTISLINSYASDVHEQHVARVAGEELPGMPVSLSSQILPEIQEYERTLTTVANSYVRPVVGRYLANMESQLADAGVRPQLRVLRSDGGLAGVEAVEVAPVTMLMSGPAGGVSGAVWAAQQAGYNNLLTFDMGGTSTDVALVQAGQPELGRETTVGDLTVRVPSIDVRTAGAGGGSIAHVPDLTKALRVGPASAGAEPGPAAYGYGGEEPTVTDANVVLGYLPPQLIGGEMTLDTEAATRAVDRIKDAMGLADTETAAAGVVDITNENMSGALRLVSVQQGHDPRDFALVAFGGAGPLHANALGKIMGSWPVVIPPSPGVLCAYGDATTTMRDEASRTYIRRSSDISDEDVRRDLEELAAQTRATLDSDGIPRAEQRLFFQVDIRYVGQGFELPVDVELEQFTGDGRGLKLAGQRFDAEHERLFMFFLDLEHELVNLRAVARSQPSQVQPPSLSEGGTDPSQARIGTSSAWIDGENVEAGLYDRLALAAGNVIAGPAIITEMDSTTLILPEHHGTVDVVGTILIRPTPAPRPADARR